MSKKQVAEQQFDLQLPAEAEAKFANASHSDAPPPPPLTSVGFFTHRLPPRKQPRVSCSYRAAWARLPVGQV